MGGEPDRGRQILRRDQECPRSGRVPGPALNPTTEVAAAAGAHATTIGRWSSKACCPRRRSSTWGAVAVEPYAGPCTRPSKRRGCVPGSMRAGPSLRCSRRWLVASSSRRPRRPQADVEVDGLMARAATPPPARRRSPGATTRAPSNTSACPTSPARARATDNVDRLDAHAVDRLDARRRLVRRVTCSGV